VGCKKCGKSFVVPPIEVPTTANVASSEGGAVAYVEPKLHSTAVADADALALSALADEPPPVEDVPVEGKPINMVCGICDHKWEVPRSMEGKNVICPDCTTRVRVPIQAEQKPKDWREAQKKPSLAKGEEAPEGAWDDQAKNVSRSTLEDAGAVLVETEPIPITTRLKRYFLIAATVGCLVFGGLKIKRSWETGTVENRMELAVKEIDKDGSEGKKRPLWLAAMQLAAGKHMVKVGIEDDKNRTIAFNHFLKASSLVTQSPPSFERNRLLIDVASQMSSFGGSKEDVKNEEKLLWSKVQTAMRQTLRGLVGSDIETRLDAVREMTRELAPLNKTDIIQSLVSELFVGASPAEQSEMLATIGIELLRLDQKEKAIQFGTEALKQGDPKIVVPVSRSMQALAIGLEMKLPQGREITFVGNISGEARSAYAMGWALRGDADKAKGFATQAGPASDRFRALVQAANLLPTEKARPLVEIAAKLALNELKPVGTAANPVSQTQLMHLARLLALDSGITDNVKLAMFVADTIRDDSVQSWAKAEILIGRLKASPDTVMADAELQHLGEPKNVSVAIGHMEFAEHNERLNDPTIAKTVDGWSEGLLRPFGLAGRALGDTKVAGK